MPLRASRSRTRTAVADLPSEFWGGWIVAITVASFVALAVVRHRRLSRRPGRQRARRSGTRRCAKGREAGADLVVLVHPGADDHLGDLRDRCIRASAPTAARSAGRWAEGSRSDSSTTKGNSAPSAGSSSRTPLAELANSNSAMRSALARVQQQLQFLPRPRCRPARRRHVSGPDGRGLAMGLRRIAGHRDDSFRPPGRHARVGSRLSASQASSSLTELRAGPLAWRGGVCCG